MIGAIAGEVIVSSLRWCICLARLMLSLCPSAEAVSRVVRWGRYPATS